MSKVIEIEETVSRTIQVRQYEPVTITSKVKATVDEADNVAEAKHKLIKGLVAVVEADLEKLYKRGK